MRRILGVFTTVMAALSVGAWCAPAQPAASASTLTVKVSLKSQIGDMGTRDAKIRGAEYWFHGESTGMRTTIIKNKDGVYQLNMLHSMAVKFAPGTSLERPDSVLVGPIGDVKAYLASYKAKKIKSQKLNGRLCDVYSFIDPAYGKKGMPCKLWVDQKGTPVRFYMDGPRPMDKIMVTYLLYRTNVTIPDSQFQLPKGYEVVDKAQIDQIRNKVLKDNGANSGKKDEPKK